MELTLEQIIALLQQGADAAPAAQIHSQVDVDFELVIEYIADDSMNPEVVLLNEEVEQLGEWVVEQSITVTKRRKIRRFM
jgi:hypothetical protein